jgi:hypothetical protein
MNKAYAFVGSEARTLSIIRGHLERRAYRTIDKVLGHIEGVLSVGGGRGTFYGLARSKHTNPSSHRCPPSSSNTV